MTKKIKLTTLIVTLVLSAIVISILAVSGAIYFSLRTQAIETGRAQLVANLGMSAIILEKSVVDYSTLRWTEGSLEEFRTFGIVPQFYDRRAMDTITRITQGAAATIYELDAATKSFTSMGTNLTDADGARLIDMVLGPADPPYADLIAGERHLGQIAMNGMDYYAAFHPIRNMSGEVIGAIFVGTPLTTIEASANGVLGPIAMVGALVTLALTLLGLVASRVITRPIPRLARAMGAIAEGNFDVDVPYSDLHNEVGEMAHAVEIFRQNGLRVSQMNEAEAVRIIADQKNRQAMMTDLQTAFGAVVDAAVAGDFTRQVEVQFPDPELNALASGVNNLVSTFNRGVSEIGQVLGAIADTDLTQRMHGNYEGAFARLKSDVNAVADRLTKVLGQLRATSGSLKAATGEILSGANDLSERTTKQASTIEETSAAMVQLASTVLQNAQRANAASASAAQVAQTAEESGEVMTAATDAMARITQSSVKISDIIGLIDDIAFQTNLLALNASSLYRTGRDGLGCGRILSDWRCHPEWISRDQPPNRPLHREVASGHLRNRGPPTTLRRSTIRKG